MTLISAVRCKDHLGHDAFVVSADAQETIEGRRVFLTKIEPRKMGKFAVVIGGSGMGDLIDGFLIRLQDSLSTTTIEDVGGLRLVIQDVLLDYMRTEVKAYSAPIRSKYLRFVIGAYDPEKREAECWVTKSSRLKPIEDFQLLGCDEDIYHYFMKRMYGSALSIGKAVRLSIHVFLMAKKTSLYIDGPTSIAIIRDIGIAMEQRKYIDNAELDILELSKAMDNLSVALPDTGMSAVEFEAHLQDFVAIAKEIRKRAVERTGHEIWEQLMEGKEYSELYSKFPDGGQIITHLDEGKVISVEFGDKPEKGLWVGSFVADNFSQEHSPADIKMCGKRRVVGNQVFVEVVPCKLPGRNHHHTPGESCIEGTWLESLTPSDT